MEHAFREGWRTSDDFVKHFPAHAIMAALKSAPELRVSILAAATGIYEEILRRKSPALAAEDLRVALEEGTTSSHELLKVFSPEDRVRYLDAHRIWDFLAEDRFWELEPDAGDEQRRGATERMVFTLSQGLSERLITLRDVLDGLTYDAVADSLSPDELRLVVRHALVKGRDGIGLSEKVLLEVLPLDKLVRSVPLDRIWHEVVIRRLAVPSGLTDLSREERRVSQAEKQADKRGPSEAMRVASRPSAPPPLPAGGGILSDHLVTAPPPASARDAQYPPYGDEYGEDEDALTAAPPPAMARDGSIAPPPPRAPLSFAQPGLPPARQAPPLPDELEPTLAQPLLTLPQPPLGAPRMPSAGQGFDPDAAERQRQRVTEHLRAIGRLPPNHASLPAAVLRSIDAMYALLPSATDDIQRKSVIRQAFASENQLRMALLGLIELMDSSVDTSDPVIQEAKIEALIKILLFEEQRRKETGRFPPGPMSATRSPSSRAPSSIPPAAPPPGGFYYPSMSPPGSYPMAMPPQAPEQGPPASNQAPAGFPAAAPPLPNLPADPSQTRRRTLPPPLPPSYRS